MPLWKLILKAHKLCPAWRYHVRRTWDFEPFIPQWFCRYCPLPQYLSIGRAYRITIQKEQNAIDMETKNL